MSLSHPIILNPSDTVAILPNGAWVGEDPLQLESSLAANIMPGHKIARRVHKAGDAVIKFGEMIGVATEEIAAGAHVHAHNCAFSDHDQIYEVGCDVEAARAAVPEVEPRTFMGYRRRNGQVGTRNFIILCATVNCSATVIRQASQELIASGILDDFDNVDGIVGLTHSTGCGMSGNKDHGLLERVLWGYATHPNAGATIFVGLGCEMMQVARMQEIFQIEGARTNLDHFHSLAIQEVGGTRKTIDAIKAKVVALLPEVNKVCREVCPASALKIALQCGGSDGFSGITANPALGKTTDLLAGLGATAILSETPEIYGAEQLLLRRAASQDIGEKLIKQIRWWEHYVAINGGSLDNNPSPGNKAGGLTTILEKSLGASAKSGSTPLNAVYDYGELVTEPGFVFMDTPGYDPVCATGQIAGGAHMVVFTTGRGSAFGSKPAPTIKIATNDRLFDSMRDDMDINCGDILSSGVSLEAKGHEILDMILAVASGERTKSELLGLGDHEFIPWQVGAVM